MSETNDKKILDLMTELGALHRGHFLLSSGMHSDTYFQCAKILQFPDLARELGRRIAENFDGYFSCVSLMNFSNSFCPVPRMMKLRSWPDSLVV